MNGIPEQSSQERLLADEIHCEWRIRMRSRVTNLSLSLEVGGGGGRGRGLRNRQRNLSLAQLLVRDWRGWGFVAVSDVQSEI